MRHRTFVALSTLSLVAILVLLYPVRSPLKPDARPNILVIVTDDQRGQGTLEVMPETRQWMMEGGITFTSAHATTPLCCPSRASLLTGRLAHNHGVYRTMADTSGPFRHESTLEFYLQRSGYRTAIFGKYLNGWNISANPPYFHRWAIFSKGYPNGYSGATWNVDGLVRRVERYSTRYVAGEAVRFVRQMESDDTRPWFLYVAPFAPHMPFRAEERYERAAVPDWKGNPAVFERDRRDKPPFVRRRAARFHATRVPGTKLQRSQLRTLMSVDDLVGQLYRTLEDLGEDRNTLAFFLSDNGYAWAEHGLRQKLSPYPESTQVPLLLRWPGHASPGRKDDRLAAVMDVAPTILEAARIAPDARYPMDARSLLLPDRRQRLLLEFWQVNDEFWQLNDVPDWASTRTARYQYVEYYNATGAVTFREYYDLVSDSWQLHNLLGDDDATNDPDIEQAAARLARDRACRGTVGRTPCP